MRREDGKCKLVYNKKGNETYYDLEWRAYDFPPLRNAPQRFIREEYFSSYIRPQDR